ncbi:Protein ltv1 [Balamuthia mandrillaris]
MPRAGGKKKKQWIDRKNATRFQLVYRSQEDPLGDGEVPAGPGGDRVLRPITNTDSKLAKELGGNDHLFSAFRQFVDKNKSARDEDDAEEDEEEGEGDDFGEFEKALKEEYGAEGEGEEGEEDEESRFADADEDEEEEKEQKKGKGKGKGKEKDEVKADATSAQVDLKQFELGEYGFPEDGYDYRKHFKPMGAPGSVYMAAPPTKEQKGGYLYKKPSIQFREEEASTYRFGGSDKVPEVLQDAYRDDFGYSKEASLAEIDKELYDALFNDDYETLNDDFVVVAKGKGEGENDDDEEDEEYHHRSQQQRGGKQEEEYDYGTDSDDDDYDAYEDYPPGQSEQRRNKGELAEIFDARFERAMAEWSDDEIGELDGEDPTLHGKLGLRDEAVKQYLDEFLESRKTEKYEAPTSAAKKKEPIKAEKKEADDVNDKGKGKENNNVSTNKLQQEDEDEDDEEEDYEQEEVQYIEEEVRDDDKWDCESILSTYSNLENHPTLIDDAPARKKRIELSKKTSIPLGVLPERPKKEKTKRNDNLGEARTKWETPEDKKARKQRVKEMRRLKRGQKKQLKQEFKQEEKRQVAQTVGTTQSIIKY